MFAERPMQCLFVVSEKKCLWTFLKKENFKRIGLIWVSPTPLSDHPPYSNSIFPPSKMLEAKAKRGHWGDSTSATNRTNNKGNWPLNVWRWFIECIDRSKQEISIGRTIQRECPWPASLFHHFGPEQGSSPRSTLELIPHPAFLPIP